MVKNKKKLKVAIHSDAPIAKTGLGRNGKALSKYLYSTGKYEIVYFAKAHSWSNVELKKLPFEAYGVLPDDQNELIQIQNDQIKSRDAQYGSLNIDKFVSEVKPDVMIFSDDSWAFPYYNKPWWNKFNCIPQITLDSLPFLPEQEEFIQKSPNFHVKALFAEDESKRLGYDHVRTMPDMIDDKDFKPLPSFIKNQLREKFGIDKDTLVCGFVFRSQLRKEIKPLLEGFKKFKKENPEVKAKLLFHTNWSEGWDIPRMLKQLEIDPADILTTYICRNCGEYEIKPFTGQEKDCPFCGAEKSQITTGVQMGVTESQLNEIYSLMDCYCHLANAGGCEMPIIEALYCGLPVATVGYSYGVTFTNQDFVFPIDFTYTVAIGTLFNRAVPNPYSVCKFLKKINRMKHEEKKQIAEKGRKFAIETFSPKYLGKRWEQLIDSLPEVNYDYNLKYEEKNPNFPFPEIYEDKEFIKCLYLNILKTEEPENSDGFNHWINGIKSGMKKQDIYEYFCKVAREENDKNKKQDIESLFDKQDKGKRILFVMPEGKEDVFILTSLFKSCKETYPDYNIYVSTKPQFQSILAGNPYVFKVLDFSPIFENELIMQGHGEKEGVVDILFLPHALTQRCLNYIRGGKDKIALDVKY